MSAAEIHDGWLEHLQSGQFRKLFDHLPGTLFFAKDLELRLMMGNSAFVARCGKKEEAEIVGLDDFSLFSAKMAEKFREDDMEVIRTGEPLMEILELFPNEHGHPDWSVTDKLPLFDRQGKVCGICGTVRSYERVRESLMPYLELQPVVAHLKKNFREKLDIAELAALAGLSVRQLERKFIKTFRLNPRGYLKRMRVLIACELLKQTDMSVTEIAMEVGFFDHSQLSRYFKEELSESPSEYRNGLKRSRGAAPLGKVRAKDP